MTSHDERHASIPIHLVHEDDLDRWRANQDEVTRNWIATNCFKAERGKVLLVPGSHGRPAALLVGLGRQNPREELTCWAAAAIPDRVPDGDYHLADALPARVATQFAFGWAYGQYRFERYRRANPQRAARLRLPSEVDAAEVERLRAAPSLARDLINTPANDMSPEALAQAY
jgi:leucyl aminopeptidase